MLLPDQISDNFSVLVISSAAGAAVRMLNPTNKDSMAAKFSQGIIGVLSAVFLGPLIGGWLTPWVSDAIYAVAVSGFICGISGIEITKAVTGKLFK